MVWSKKKNAAAAEAEGATTTAKPPSPTKGEGDQKVTSDEWGYPVHATPILEEGGNGEEGGAPPVVRIPGEPGYFPTGSGGGLAPLAVTGLEKQEAERPLVSFPNARLYQMHPRYQRKSKQTPNGMKKKRDWLGRTVVLTKGELTLRDPAAGTADEVALVGECDGLSFYVMKDDATARVSNTEFVLLLPKDCIGVDLSSPKITPEARLRFEGLLCMRTKFHDESGRRVVTEEDKDELDRAEREALVPDDPVSKSIYRMSRWVSDKIVEASEDGAQRIGQYGEAKRASVVETRDVKVSKSSIKLANSVRNVSQTTSNVAVGISDKISDVVGGTVGKHAAIKEGDGKGKRGTRRVLLASSIGYAEVADGVGKAYENMVTAAKDETTAFVAKKYGQDAAQLTRHTAGAAANFGRAALSARRIVNVKQVIRSSGKKMVKESIKQSIKGN